jgi:Fe-S cluster assembly ATP-binding protein
MFTINNFSVSINNKKILNCVNLVIDSGSVCALMGPNGSGKSSLAFAIMGHPDYAITAGTLMLDGFNIVSLSVDKRALMGVFLSFQQPVALSGVTVFTFLYESYRLVKDKDSCAEDFEIIIKSIMDILSIEYAFMHRALNDQFSGGEKKKFELLQLLLLQPTLAILDEIDSGLDVDALKIVATGIAYARKKNPMMCILLITHYARLLRYVVPDSVYVLANGSIVHRGDAELAWIIDQHGYKDLAAI